MTEANKLTDEQLKNLWMTRDCMAAIQAGDLLAQLIWFARAIESAILSRASDAQDAARLDWMAQEECYIEHLTLGNGTRYRVYWALHEEAQSDWFRTPREAIDAAMTAERKEPQ